MASAPPLFASTKETTNYARLCRLLVDVGSQALRSTFDKIHPPATLHTVLSSTSVHYTTLQSLYRGRKKVLNPTQWGKLYPVHSPASSATFDITLLTVLLRNICGLSPPVTGWDNLPPATNTSIADDIARVKYYRNTLYGHASQASVDDISFSSYWQEIRDALVRLGGAPFRADIDKLEHDCMDPDTEDHYRELMKQWKKDDDSIKDKLEEMEESIKDSVMQMRSEVQNTLGKIESEVKEVKEKLGTVADSAEKSKNEVQSLLTMSALKGETLTLKSKGETVTIHWKQGSFFGVGGDRNQNYVLCDYALANGNHVPVYIQRGYDIPQSLTIDSRLQYGVQENVLFFVYHDKEQKQFQERFRCSDLHAANNLLKTAKGVNIDISWSWVAGEYLVNV